MFNLIYGTYLFIKVSSKINFPDLLRKFLINDYKPFKSDMLGFSLSHQWTPSKRYIQFCYDLYILCFNGKPSGSFISMLYVPDSKCYY